jgi:hypothetical protein
VTALTPAGTMIVPVSHALFGDLPERTSARGVPLVRKAELHMTVFNFALGRRIKQAVDADPGFGAAINACAATFAWQIKPTGRYYALLKAELLTVVTLVDASIWLFYANVRALTTGEGPLRDALELPPPPHVTLYTSDPEGKKGIGLNTAHELEQALKPSLVAFPWTP